MDECPFCDRICPRCRYPIDGGWEHIEVPQVGKTHVVCRVERVVRPLVEILPLFVEHQQHSRLRLVEQQPTNS
jgi:hypothetical protein